jgi:hypothetical protein
MKQCRGRCPAEGQRTDPRAARTRCAASATKTVNLLDRTRRTQGTSREGSRSEWSAPRSTIRQTGLRNRLAGWSEVVREHRSSAKAASTAPLYRVPDSGRDSARGCGRRNLEKGRGWRHRPSPPLTSGAPAAASHPRARPVCLRAVANPPATPGVVYAETWRNLQPRRGVFAPRAAPNFRSWTPWISVKQRNSTTIPTDASASRYLHHFESRACWIGGFGPRAFATATNFLSLGSNPFSPARWGNSAKSLGSSGRGFSVTVEQRCLLVRFVRTHSKNSDPNLGSPESKRFRWYSRMIWPPLSTRRRTSSRMTRSTAPRHAATHAGDACCAAPLAALGTFVSITTVLFKVFWTVASSPDRS